MKARVVGVRPALGAVVGAEVVAIAAFASLPPYRFGWWPMAAISAAAVILLLVTVHRRNAVRWTADRVHWLRDRRYATPVAAAVDISHGGRVCGVRTAGDEAVTVIRVDGRAHEPTLLHGSTVSLTSNVLPLEVLTELLQQPGGLNLGIDIPCAGYRVRAGTGYPQLYSTLLADRGAAGQRIMHLIVRLNISESIRGLAYRRSIGTAAAAATERIIKALQQHGIRSSALNAEEQDAVLEQLSGGLALAPERPAPIEEHVDGDDFDDVIPERNGAPVPELATVGAKHRAPERNHGDEQPSARRVRLTADVRWNTINANQGL